MDSRKKYLREEYTARINRVIDHIQANLAGDLSLQDLAAVAGFSPFHFHRLFSAMVGEPLGGFIRRLRVEKAAAMLRQNRRKSITEIALDCGFSGSSVFARTFQETYRMSASEWRSGGRAEDNVDQDSKKSKAVSNIQQDFNIYPSYTVATVSQSWRVEMKGNQELITNIEVKDVPEIPVAYLRYIGPYAGNEQLFGDLFNKLCAWAGPRGLLRFPETKFISIYHDDPEITDETKLRTDVCITVAPETEVDGEVGKAVIPAGKYAVAHFEIFPNQYSDAWNAVYGGWFPESGYQPDDRPCFELYLNDAKEHPEGKHVVDIYAPVKPL